MGRPHQAPGINPSAPLWHDEDHLKILHRHQLEQVEEVVEQNLMSPDMDQVEDAHQVDDVERSYLLFRHFLMFRLFLFRFYFVYTFN